MKKTLTIIVLSLLVLLMFWWWSTKKQSPTLETAVILKATTNTSVTAGSTNLSREESMKVEVKKYDTLTNRPIEFYGKVVDQDGNPIAGAPVKIFVRRTTGFMSSKGYDYQTVTDEDGLFSYSGAAGELMAISAIEKAGYELLTRKTSYKYSMMGTDEKHSPDPNNPVIIKMWKKKGPEPLYYWRKDFNYPADGTPAYIDLEKGQVVSSGGDLKVTFLRDPVVLPADQYQLHWRWKLSLEAVDGGLIEGGEDKEKIFEVPLNGYAPSWQDNGVQHNNKDRYFIFKTRNGKNYGKMSFSYGTGGITNGFVSIRVFLNPNSSRNLEYAPNLQINDKSERP